MLYLAIDQHSKQLTVNLRNEEGRVFVKRQVSTQWSKVRDFCVKLKAQSAEHGGCAVILEVCGFNDWLIKLLDEYGIREIVLIQPKGRSNHKTDRRDANELGELLWLNRHRLLQGERVFGVRRIRICSEENAINRRLTARRVRVSRELTRIVNRIKGILRRHNLEQHQPTKGLQTHAAMRWLNTVDLPKFDRVIMDQLLADFQTHACCWVELDELIKQRCVDNSAAQQLATLTGGIAGFIALTLASRIDDIRQFPTARSLANYWGLVPRCHNSGEATGRLGSITKEGSPLARYALGQLVLHVLRRDSAMRQWHRRIKLRRGSKIARVAVMRRLSTIIWSMLRHQEPYYVGGKPKSPVTNPTSSNDNSLGNGSTVAASGEATSKARKGKASSTKTTGKRQCRAKPDAPSPTVESVPNARRRRQPNGTSRFSEAWQDKKPVEKSPSSSKARTETAAADDSTSSAARDDGFPS